MSTEISRSNTLLLPSNQAHPAITVTSADPTSYPTIGHYSFESLEYAIQGGVYVLPRSRKQMKSDPQPQSPKRRPVYLCLDKEGRGLGEQGGILTEVVCRGVNLGQERTKVLQKQDLRALSVESALGRKVGKRRSEAGNVACKGAKKGVHNALKDFVGVFRGRKEGEKVDEKTRGRERDVRDVEWNEKEVLEPYDGVLISKR